MAYIKQLTSYEEQSSAQENIYPVTVGDAVINPSNKNSITQDLSKLYSYFGYIAIDNIKSLTVVLHDFKLYKNKRYKVTVIGTSGSIALFANTEDETRGQTLIQGINCGQSTIIIPDDNYPKISYYASSSNVQNIIISYEDSKDIPLINKDLIEINNNINSILTDIQTAFKGFGKIESIYTWSGAFITLAGNLQFGVEADCYKYKVSPNKTLYVEESLNEINIDFGMIMFRDASGNVLQVISTNDFIASNGIIKVPIPDSSDHAVIYCPKSNKTSLIVKTSDVKNIELIHELQDQVNQLLSKAATVWENKTILFWGDSITQMGQDYGTGIIDGHGTFPYQEPFGWNWQERFCSEMKFKEFYSRGIGSAMWTHSEYVAYIDNATGKLIKRPNPFVKFEDAPDIEGQTKVHFGLSDWDRIKAQIPEDIRAKIDVIFMFCTNSILTKDLVADFSANNNQDTAWATDTAFNKFGGDYNVLDHANAIISTIMKLQIWCPNAKIVIGTQLSGRGPVDGSNTANLNTAISQWESAQITKKVAGVMSIPCIDIYGTDGINPLNRHDYIADEVHPYKENGCKMLVSALCGGFNSLIPKL